MPYHYLHGQQGRIRVLLALAFTIIVILLLTSQRQKPTQLYRRPDVYDGIYNGNVTDADGVPRASSLHIAPFHSTAGNPPAPDSQLHIALSHYNEQPFYIARMLSSLRAIETIAALKPHVTLYTKFPDADLESLRTVSTADTVISLPNVGREGGTYLHHILANWANLPAYTLFSQAVIRGSQIEGSGEKAGMLQEWLTARLSDEFSGGPRPNGSATGFLSLNRDHAICYCGHCSDIGARDQFYPLWPQLFALITGRVCGAGEPSVLSFNGHFIVSKKRILARPRRLYEYLQRLVDAPADHWVHGEVEPKWTENEFGQSRPDTPKFGHTLERLWHALFDCGDVGQVRNCDVDGLHAQGSGGCSCEDIEDA